MSSFAQVTHSVYSEDMLAANCRPDINLRFLSKAEYIKHFKSIDINTKGMNSELITIEHLNDIYTSFMYFPEWMSIRSNADWNKTRVVFNPNYLGYADHRIALGVKWTQMPSLQRQSVLIHEIFHRISDKYLDISQKDTWINLDNSWDEMKFISRVGYVGTPSAGAEFVSTRAAFNSKEDWAESLSSYRINPHLLKSVSQKKYDFIKENVYFGIEYIDNSQCDDVPNFLTDTREVQKLHAYIDSNYRSLKKIVKKYPNRGFTNALIMHIKSTQKENEDEQYYSLEDMKLKLLIENNLDELIYNQLDLYEFYLKKSK